MEVTVKQKAEFGREYLEQIASNAPIPTMGGLRISELEQKALAELCSILAKNYLDCVASLAESYLDCVDSILKDTP